MSNNISAVVRRQTIKTAKSRDQKLRSAISLYHLSPSFYPVPVSSASTSASPSTAQGLPIDDAIDKTLQHDIWGSKDLERHPGIKDSIPSFYGGDYLVSQLNHITTHGPNDGSKSRDAIAYLTSRSLADRSSSSSHSPLAPERSTRDAALENLRKSFLSKRNVVVQFPLSPRPELEENEPEQIHIQAGGSVAVAEGPLDERSARIRDALFGTVGGGERPGLEVVRERRSRHHQQEARDKQS